MSQPAKVRTVRVNQPDFQISPAICGKGDRLAIGGPTRMRINRGIFCESQPITSRVRGNSPIETDRASALVVGQLEIAG